MKFSIVTEFHIFFKRYLFQSLTIGLLYIFIISFTVIIASIGYEEDFNYRSQSFLRQLSYMGLLPLAVLVLMIISWFLYSKKERKILVIYHKSHYGNKNWIAVCICTLILIVLSFKLSRIYFFKVYNIELIKDTLFHLIVTVFTSFVLMMIFIMLYKIEVNRSKDYRRPLLLLRSFNDDSYEGFASNDGLKSDYFKSILSTVAQRFKSLFPSILYDDELSEKSRVNQFGSLTFSKKNDWIGKVEELSKHSVAIIIIPIPTEGIIEEINMMIISNLMSKVYFLMPPENVFLLSENRIEKTWEKNRTEFLKVNITLPKFISSGSLFSVNEDFTMNKVINLNYSINSVIALRKLIKKEELYSDVSLKSILEDD